MYAEIPKFFDTDVLVIGGGAAALRAALTAADNGVQVTVVLKGLAGKSGATVSPDSDALAWQVADGCSSEEDSPDRHASNIVEAGLAMADPNLAGLLAQEIVDRTEEFEQWGLRFIPDPAGERKHYSGYSCFADQPRAHGVLNTGLGHGGDVVRILVDQLRKHHVRLHENVFVSDLLVSDGQCVGALCLGLEGELLVYRAGAVVLGRVERRQIYPPEPGRSSIDTTGDSYAMALRAGAELANMEFTQYMLHPVKPFPVSAPGVFWSLCPTVRNRHGEDVLAAYLPHGICSEQVLRQRTLHYPFSCRDHSKWLDFAFEYEIRAGRGTEDGGLYLDFSQVDLTSFRPSLPQHRPDDWNRPIRLPDGPVQARPAAHAINGGILIDEHAESSLPGLFAVAEAAAGPHGADRLGGCMVSGGQVFGARAGRFAAHCARSSSGRAVPKRAMQPALERLRGYGRGGRDPEAVLAALQLATGRHLIVVRTRLGVESLLETIRELRDRCLPQVSRRNAAVLRRAMEVGNSLITTELMARAALCREESRGSHFREDFPEQDDSHWRRSIIFRQVDGELRQETRSLAGGAGPVDDLIQRKAV